MIKQWLSPIESILALEGADLRTLAESVDADVRNFYMWQDLSKCDLSGQDLRGMNLTGTNISTDNIDLNTKLDLEFDPVFRFEADYVSFTVSHELLSMIYAYSEKRRYVYRAWAIKNLLEIGIHRDKWLKRKLVEIIKDNESLSQLLILKRGATRRLKVQVYGNYQERVFEISRSRNDGINKQIYPNLILEGLVADQFEHRIPDQNHDIYHFSIYDRSKYFLNEIKSGRL